MCNSEYSTTPSVPKYKMVWQFNLNCQNVLHFHTEGVPNKPLPAPSEAEKPVPFAMSIGLSVQRVLLVQTFWAALENALGKKSTNPEVSPLLPLAEPGKMSEKAEQIIWFVDDANVYRDQSMVQSLFVSSFLRKSSRSSQYDISKFT